MRQNKKNVEFESKKQTYKKSYRYGTDILYDSQYVPVPYADYCLCRKTDLYCRL